MCDGKDKLRQRLKEKRVNEGLGDIPDDLFEKKPRHEMTQEEKTKTAERRKKNKEAAEKSRKRKKEEFERLQLENDQLTQDKCDLTALIQSLKDKLQEQRQTNERLQLTNESLKRWIAKRANELGLGKHFYKDLKNKQQKHQHSTAHDAGDSMDSSDSVLRGDPSFGSHSLQSDKDNVNARLQASPRTMSSTDALPASPGNAESPTHVSSASARDLPASCITEPSDVSSTYNNVPHEPRSPDQTCDGEQIVVSGHVEHGEQGDVYYEHVGEEEVVYLTPGTILVVHDDPQVPSVTSSSSPQHPEGSEVVSSISKAMAVLNGDVGDAVASTVNVSSATHVDTEVAIETLLRQGYKVEMPSAGVLRKSGKREAHGEENVVQVELDHNYRTVPVGLAPQLPTTTGVGAAPPGTGVQVSAGSQQFRMIPISESQYLTLNMPVTV